VTINQWGWQAEIAMAMAMAMAPKINHFLQHLLQDYP